MTLKGATKWTTNPSTVNSINAGRSCHRCISWRPRPERRRSYLELRFLVVGKQVAERGDLDFNSSSFSTVELSSSSLSRAVTLFDSGMLACLCRM
jgi:hypothetical protein